MYTDSLHIVLNENPFSLHGTYGIPNCLRTKKEEWKKFLPKRTTLQEDEFSNRIVTESMRINDFTFIPQFKTLML